MAPFELAEDDGTIDLTDVIEKMKTTFVLAAKDYLVLQALAVPGLGTIAAWFVRVLGSAAIDWTLNKLANWTVMQAFFLNTAMRKLSQAKEYVIAVNEKENLSDASEVDYEKAERKEIDLFIDFVRISN